jgi:hypothetical protein
MGPIHTHAQSGWGGAWLLTGRDVSIMEMSSGRYRDAGTRALSRVDADGRRRAGRPRLLEIGRSIGQQGTHQPGQPTVAAMRMSPWRKPG